MIWRNLKSLEGSLQALDNIAQETGLIINQETTKYMRISKKTRHHCKNIAIGGGREV
jgi:hypothetical protein